MDGIQKTLDGIQQTLDRHTASLNSHTASLNTILDLQVAESEVRDEQLQVIGEDVASLKTGASAQRAVASVTLTNTLQNLRKKRQDAKDVLFNLNKPQVLIARSGMSNSNNVQIVSLTVFFYPILHWGGMLDKL